MAANQKVRDLRKAFFGSPSADMIFLLDTRALCIEKYISAKKTAQTPNWPWRCAGAAALDLDEIKSLI